LGENISKATSPLDKLMTVLIVTQRGRKVIDNAENKVKGVNYVQ